MHADYLAKSPNPDKLQDLLDKLGAFIDGTGLVGGRHPRHRGAHADHGR